jgi:hypothetical protein
VTEENQQDLGTRNESGPEKTGAHKPSTDEASAREKRVRKRNLAAHRDPRQDLQARQKNLIREPRLKKTEKK